MYSTRCLLITCLILSIVVFYIYFFHHENFIIKSSSNCMEKYFDMIVCICLPERKTHMKNVFSKWGFKNVLFFDPYLKNHYSHEYFIKKGFLSPNYHSYLNVGRICCHYSAISVYKQFLRSSANTLLVFEDDLKESTYDSPEDFNNAMCPVIDAIPNDWEYLNFSKCYDSCAYNTSIQNKYWNIPIRPLCRTAIALKKQAAKIIVDETQPMNTQPGDKMIGNLIKNKKFKAYATKNLCFYQHREQFGSNLQNNSKTNPPMCIRSLGIVGF